LLKARKGFGGSSSQSPAATDAIRSAKSSSIARSTKSSLPESARACILRCRVGGSAHGENPSRFVRSSAQANKFQGFVLSFPLFRLSRSDNLPRVQCDSHAEGDISVFDVANSKVFAVPQGM